MGFFADTYDLSSYGGSSGLGSFETQPADGTPRQSDGGFYGMLQDVFKTGVNGYIAVQQAQASGTQPETTYEQRVVPDTNLAETVRQAGQGGTPWLLIIGAAVVLIGVVLIVKD